MDAARTVRPSSPPSWSVVDVKAAVVDRRRKHQLHGLVRTNVEAGSSLYTDALKSYDGLADDFTHKVVDHAETYVDGRLHTNNCENF